MLTAAITIASTAHTAAAVGQADRRLAGAARVARWVTDDAGVAHALTAVAVAIIAAVDAAPVITLGDAERRRGVTARVIIAGVTGEAVPCHTLTGVRIIAVGVFAA